MSLLKTGFFGWDNAKWLLKELIKTLGDKPSYFSSKRLERVALFWCAIFIVMNYYRVSYDKLTPSDIVLLTTPLFAYAGFNTIMNNKEKKKIIEEEKNKENGEN